MKLKNRENAGKYCGKNPGENYGGNPGKLEQQARSLPAAPEILTWQYGPELLDFQRFLESCIGPRGNLKMIVSSAGSTMVTSSYSRLWSYISLDHPIVELLLQTARNLSDFRLFSTILATRLLINSQSTKVVYQPENIGKIIDAAAVKIDVGNLHHLISVAQTVLSSKPGTGWLPSQLPAKARLIVTAWLKTVREDGRLGEVCVRLRDGTEDGVVAADGGRQGRGRGLGDIEDRVEDGLVLRLPPGGDAKWEKMAPLNSSVRVALYDVMLDSDQSCDEWPGLHLEYGLTSNMRQLCEERNATFTKLLKHRNVNLLCCRKVVGPELTFQLEKSGILVLERLGTNNFYRMERLAGGVTQSSIKSQLLEGDIGHVESLALQAGQEEGVTFLKLNNPGSGQVQLVVNSMGEEQGAEIIHLVSTAVQALNTIVQNDAQVLPGAGCLESRVALSLLTGATTVPDTVTGATTAQHTVTGDTTAQYTITGATIVPDTLRGATTAQHRVKGAATAQHTVTGATTVQDTIIGQNLLKMALLYRRLDIAEAMIDTDYGHLWENSDSMSCCCGLVAECSSKLSCLEIYHYTGRKTVQQLAKPEIRETLGQDVVFVDNLREKKRALLAGIESATNLANIGAILKC